MNIGIRKAQKEKETVANFQEIAQSFWKETKSKSSENDSSSTNGNNVNYVGGNFTGTFTNKEIERLEKEAESATSPDTPPDQPNPALHYERFFD